jgi:hypothetical protein
MDDELDTELGVPGLQAALNESQNAAVYNTLTRFIQQSEALGENVATINKDVNGLRSAFQDVLCKIEDMYNFIRLQNCRNVVANLTTPYRVRPYHLYFLNALNQLNLLLTNIHFFRLR